MNKDFEELLSLSDRIGEMDWSKDDATELLGAIRRFIELLVPGTKIAEGLKRLKIEYGYVLFEIYIEYASVQVTAEKEDGLSLIGTLRAKGESEILRKYCGISLTHSFLEAMMSVLFLSYCELVPSPMFEEERIDASAPDITTVRLRPAEQFEGTTHTLSRELSQHISDTDSIAKRGRKVLNARKGRLSSVKRVPNSRLLEIAPLFERSLLFNVEASEWKNSHEEQEASPSANL